MPYQNKKEESLVKLADVIKPVELKPSNLPVSYVPGDESAHSVLWSYTAPTAVKEKPKEPEEKDHTPSFDFSEKVSVEGKERKIELTPSGLYIFDKKEKFEAKQIIPSEKTTNTAGVWVGVKKPFSDGRVMVPLMQRGGFPVIKIRGKTIEGILALTKKR